VQHAADLDGAHSDEELRRLDARAAPLGARQRNRPMPLRRRPLTRRLRRLRQRDRTA
jgi:hypothetical protein